jgi:hypothetical protein
VLKKAGRRGGKLPDVVENAPTLQPGLIYYYLIWQELSADRQIGFGLGPIPSSSIRCYCKDEQLTDDETYDVTYLVRALDRAFLDHAAQESKRKSDKLEN